MSGLSRTRAGGVAVGVVASILAVVPSCGSESPGDGTSEGTSEGTAEGTSERTPESATEATSEGISADDRALAREQFETHCSTCHGLDGKGHGPASMSLNPRPRDWTDAEWQSTTPDEALELVIAEGGPALGLSSAMPASPHAARHGVIKALAAIVRGFGK